MHKPAKIEEQEEQHRQPLLNTATLHEAVHSLEWKLWNCAHKNIELIRNIQVLHSKLYRESLSSERCSSYSLYENTSWAF